MSTQLQLTNVAYHNFFAINIKHLYNNLITIRTLILFLIKKSKGNFKPKQRKANSRIIIIKYYIGVLDGVCVCVYIYIQGVTGATDQTSGGCSLC